MKWSVVLLPILLVACASKKPERKIASVSSPEVVRVIDMKKSHVEIFPAVAADSGLWYYFFVQLKDQSGRYIDCRDGDLSLKNHRKKVIPFNRERVSVGRYYLSLEKTAEISSGELDFFVQGKALKEHFRLNYRQPSREHTTFSVLRNEGGKITLRLVLADKLNRKVELPDKPEIILEGQGIIEDLHHTGEGTWEFSVIYPEENQIMYFSVRAMGLLLTNLYRYQHIEK